jgi:hypothetical protein
MEFKKSRIFFKPPALRLGLPLVEPPPGLRCTCTRTCFIEPNANHLLCCSKDGNIISRHNQLVYTISSLASECNIKSSTNFQQIIFPTTNTQADFVLFRPNFNENDEGRTYVYDVVVTHPAADTYIDCSLLDPSYCLHQNRAFKNDKYLQLADENGKLFYPLIFYSFGNVSEEVSSLLSCLASKSAEQRLQYSQTKFYVETSVMATLMRCTARMIIDRFDTILHQHTVPFTHIDRSSEETAMPDFAEDDVNDLLELLLTLPDNSIFPFHDNSLTKTPSF